MASSSKIRVAVLRGGPSYGYENSLETGRHILSALREMPDAYEPSDIFISRSGEWHREGLVEEPYGALRHTDVVWNALHGPYGEDGQVQRILEDLRLPFTGSGAEASALSVDKDAAKRIYRKLSLPTPAHELFTEEDLNEDRLIAVFRTYLHPVIVKPADGAGSVGVRLARTFHELKEAVRRIFSHSPKVLVEEFIKGGEASCVVVEEARGEKLYTFLPVGRSEFKLGPEENRQIEEMAKKAHEALGLHHYSGSDFIVTPNRKIYILETNSLPTLHEGSPTHQALGATGWQVRDFVEHVLKLAICK